MAIRNSSGTGFLNYATTPKLTRNNETLFQSWIFCGTVYHRIGRLLAAIERYVSLWEQDVGDSNLLAQTK